MENLRAFIMEEDGVGVIEVVLILVDILTIIIEDYCVYIDGMGNMVHNGIRYV